MANSNNPKVREEGIIKWNEAAKKYGPYYETIKNKLPKKFLIEFEKNSEFHDFTFDNINIANSGKNISTVEWVINHEDVSYKITLSGARGFTIDVPNSQWWLFGKLSWGYTEFELNDDGTWIIRILCDIECEIEVLFKRISILKL